MLLRRARPVLFDEGGQFVVGPQAWALDGDAAVIENHFAAGLDRHGATLSPCSPQLVETLVDDFLFLVNDFHRNARVRMFNTLRFGHS